MSVAVSELVTRPKFPSAKTTRVVIKRTPLPPTKATETPLLLRILTTSLVAHLLLVGLLGSGLPKPQVRPKRSAVPPAVATLIEDVKLQEEPPPEELKKPVDQSQVLPAPELPAASTIDLPPLSQVETISAVPASVPVAFGIEVKGRVRLVADASQASGAVGGRALQDPVTIDGNSSQAKNLLLPQIAYPSDALVRHLQGTVVLEFRTTDTGEINSTKVRTSSGFPILDRAALNNLAQGRWLGRAGYFLKTYEFKLN